MAIRILLKRLRMASNDSLVAFIISKYGVYNIVTPATRANRGHSAFASVVSSKLCRLQYRVVRYLPSDKRIPKVLSRECQLRLSRLRVL